MASVKPQCKCVSNTLKALKKEHGQEFGVESARDAMSFGEKRMDVYQYPFTVSVRSEKKKGSKYIKKIMTPIFCCFCGERLFKEGV